MYLVELKIKLLACASVLAELHGCDAATARQSCILRYTYEDGRESVFARVPVDADEAISVSGTSATGAATALAEAVAKALAVAIIGGFVSVSCAQRTLGYGLVVELDPFDATDEGIDILRQALDRAVGIAQFQVTILCE